MTQVAYQDSTLFHTPWPSDVTARYLTVGGASVDITFAEHSTLTGACEADCLGCGASDWDAHSQPIRTEDEARTWAQQHAETCRAMPRPANP